jgi:glycosyltransferase involved in cell wall biosynthesis
MLGGRRVSGFVLTRNEAANIGDCLKSMQWADELVVVDSFSQDATVQIARQFTDRVIQRQFAGYVAQTRFGFEQTTCEWVLWLDADERLTPEALQEVRQRFERPGGPDADAYAFPRKTCFLDRWIRHSGWYPDRKVRLFRRDVTRIEGTEPHPVAAVQGSVAKLKGDILHYSYPGGVTQMFQKSADFADRTARVRYERAQRFSILRLTLEPPVVFLARYLLRLGVLDGIPGLCISASAGYYRFMRQMKLWELAHAKGPGGQQPPAGPARGA